MQGELPVHLTTDKRVLHLLGPGKRRQTTLNPDHQQQQQQPEPDFGFTPNYLQQIPPVLLADEKKKFKGGDNNKSEIHNDVHDDNDENVLILKVRLNGEKKRDFEKDFIEIDIPKRKECLTFTNLIYVICEEFSVEAAKVVKVRKLPNTKLRRDAEVARMQDYTEIELILKD